MKIETNSETVVILMSTFNGDRYISRQIDSILRQSYQNIKLIIRDDGSSDETIVIIEQYVKNNPHQIFFLNDKLGNLGSTRSFFVLISNLTTKSYIMFSDQDDVWFQDKIDLFLSRIKKLELNNGNLRPAMVFGDMVVTDFNLNIIDSSFWHFQKINPKVILNWKKTLSQNIVTGCSMIINSEAQKLFKIIPPIIMIHDHFIAIKIAKEGLVDYINEPTMYYVQHQNNVVGASSFNLKFIFNRILSSLNTWSSYFKLCKFYEMNFFYFVYYKFLLNIQRLFQ